MKDRPLKKIYDELENARRLLHGKQTSAINIMRLAEVVCTLLYTYDNRTMFEWELEREVMWTLADLLRNGSKEALEAYEKLENAMSELNRTIDMAKIGAVEIKG